MRVANSQMHRRSGKMESVSKAIAHLGIRGLKNILMGLVGRQIFVSHDPRMNSTLLVLKTRDGHCDVARDVAGICGCRDVEPAYMWTSPGISGVGVAVYLLGSNADCLFEKQWTGSIMITGWPSSRNSISRVRDY